MDRALGVTEADVAVIGAGALGQIAAYLLDLPGSVEAGVPMVELPMAKRDIAAYLGTTPETLSRRLAALSASGIIELHGRRDIAILDVDRLEGIAEPH